MISTATRSHTSPQNLAFVWRGRDRRAVLSAGAQVRIRCPMVHAPSQPPTACMLYLHSVLPYKPGSFLKFKEERKKVENEVKDEGWKEGRQNRVIKKGGMGGTEQLLLSFVLGTLTVSSHFSYTQFILPGKYDWTTPWKTPGPLNNMLCGSGTETQT